MSVDVNDDTLALDVTQKVGPGGHYLAQKHTRKHMRTAMVPGLGHQMDAEGRYRDPLEVAREKVKWILEHYEPEPLESAKQAELTRILAAADKEIG
jgi:trimethylamine--corrinoid protein Co-methyltransferase